MTSVDLVLADTIDFIIVVCVLKVRKCLTTRKYSELYFTYGFGSSNNI